MKIKPVLFPKQKLTDVEGDLAGAERAYAFVGVRRLIEDFQRDVAHWKKGRGD